MCSQLAEQAEKGSDWENDGEAEFRESKGKKKGSLYRLATKTMEVKQLWHAGTGKENQWIVSCALGFYFPFEILCVRQMWLQKSQAFYSLGNDIMTQPVTFPPGNKP